MNDIPTQAADVNGIPPKFLLQAALHVFRRRLNMNVSDMCIGYHLIALYKPEKGYSWAHQKSLAKWTCMDEKTVGRCQRRLVEKFELFIKKSQGRNDRANEFVPSPFLIQEANRMRTIMGLHDEQEGTKVSSCGDQEDTKLSSCGSSEQEDTKVSSLIPFP